ncbi:bacillithiol biosynthesis deacetylase BshB1 [Flavobacteriaceae bacterium MAR_2010_188]|nr:bacillithiol biosynthesis deacetylase BshB1 [Flavobacteriaceae bacterium MAR_2010_188]
MKLDILAFGSHPDDVELGCGGTLAKEISKGKKVGIIDLTRGELGTRGNVETRKSESEKASAILGVEFRHNLGFSDGFFINDQTHQLEIIKKIRKYKPKLVLCNSIYDRHIDHGKGSDLVSHSCFLSGLVKIETKDEDGKVQDKWRPEQVFHYIQWLDIKPDVVVDISGYIDIKMKAVLAYETQFYKEGDTDLETPISSKNFTDSLNYRARDLGRLIGKEHGEGFTVERYVAVDSLFDLV